MEVDSSSKGHKLFYVITTKSGCPMPGFYGENCSIPCPVNCQGTICDVIEGTCLGGCASGYLGEMCSEGNITGCT